VPPRSLAPRLADGDREHARRGRGGRNDVVVDGDELPALGQEERKVPIAPDSAMRRLDDEAGEGRCHDRIDRISPCLEHPCAGLGFTRVPAGDDAVLGSRLPGHASTSSFARV
jgi:hypothetical protein